MERFIWAASGILIDCGLWSLFLEIKFVLKGKGSLQNGRIDD
jgi:hypothetical protein